MLSKGEGLIPTLRKATRLLKLPKRDLEKNLNLPGEDSSSGNEGHKGERGGGLDLV